MLLAVVSKSVLSNSPFFARTFFPQTKSVQHNSPFFFRMQIVAVGAKDSLAGWTGSSVALPKVAADDIPVLPKGAFRPLSLSHAPKDSKGRAESPLVCPQTQVCPTHLQGKVGEGIANPFPKGALLAPRASGKPLLAPAGAKSRAAHRRSLKKKNGGRTFILPPISGVSPPFPLTWRIP